MTRDWQSAGKGGRARVIVTSFSPLLPMDHTPALNSPRTRRRLPQRRVSSWPCRAESIHPSWRPCWRRTATMSSASRCRLYDAGAPDIAARKGDVVAPGATSTMRARSRGSSASRITCSTTRAAFATRSSRPSPTLTSRAKHRSLASAAISTSNSPTSWERPRDLGADAMATGHYVSSRATETGRALYRARERDRDQSYFLYATTQAQLDLLRFPLGELTKARNARPRASLRPSGRREGRQPGHLLRSQPAATPTLIARLRPDAALSGDIVDLKGEILGQHRGIMHYTVGQRRGARLGRERGGAVASRSMS